MIRELATPAPAWWTVAQAAQAAAEGRPWPVSGDHTTRAQHIAAAWPQAVRIARAG